MAENLGQVDVVLKSDGTPSSPAATSSGAGQGGILGTEHVEQLLENIEDTVLAQFDRIADLLVRIADGLGPPDIEDAEGLADMQNGGGRNVNIIAIAKKLFVVLAASLTVIGAVVYATATTIKKWNTELAITTERLSRLNGNAALAGVIERLGEFRRDLQLGRVVGPTLLKIAQMKDAVADNIAPLKNMFTALKARTMEMLWASFETVTGFLKPFGEAIKKVTNFINSKKFAPAVGSAGRVLMHSSTGFGRFVGIGLSLLSATTRAAEAQEENNEIEKDDAAHRAAMDSNSMLMAHLATLTNNLWTYQTQSAGALATGAQINPVGFANSQRPKPAPKAPAEKKQKRQGRTRFGS